MRLGLRREQRRGFFSCLLQQFSKFDSYIPGESSLRNTSVQLKCAELMWAAEAQQQQDAGGDEAWDVSHSDRDDGGIATTGAPSHAQGARRADD